jgi:Flp pilus assembly protein TadD
LSATRRLPLVVLALAVAAAACATTHGGGDPSRPGYGARSKLAHELVSRGDWARAFAMLDELHRENPEDADVLVLRGIVFRERGLFEDGAKDLKEAIKLAPENADAHAALGILYDVQLQPEAEAEHRAAVKLAPNNPAYLNNLGFSLFLRQHFKEAITVYESAARLAPLSRRVRTNLGFACAALGDLRRAAREFQMGGTESEAKNNLGFAYERRGDMANAYDLYVEAVRLDPKAERARSNLVHAAVVLGRPVPPEAAAPAAEGATAPSVVPNGDAAVVIDAAAKDAVAKDAAAKAAAAPKAVPADAPKKEAHP